MTLTIDKYEDVKLNEIIKDNIYTCVYKAQYEDQPVAVKKIKKEQLKDENRNSASDITFWYQRYYYYSKYDEGIHMDEESNSF